MSPPDANYQPDNQFVTATKTVLVPGSTTPVMEGREPGDHAMNNTCNDCDDTETHRQALQHIKRQTNPHQSGNTAPEAANAAHEIATEALQHEDN